MASPPTDSSTEIAKWPSVLVFACPSCVGAFALAAHKVTVDCAYRASTRLDLPVKVNGGRGRRAGKSECAHDQRRAEQVRPKFVLHLFFPVMELVGDHSRAATPKPRNPHRRRGQDIGADPRSTAGESPSAHPSGRAKDRFGLQRAPARDGKIAMIVRSPITRPVNQRNSDPNQTLPKAFARKLRSGRAA